jgi:VCBS repeat-containing protein
VTVTVLPVNDGPVANADAAATNEDLAITIDVLGNDTDVDGNLDANSVVALTQPVNGVVTTNGTSLVYTPLADFHGTNSFEYQVCDLGGLCATATVTLTVSPLNDSPFASDDVYDVTEDSILNVSEPGLLGNDSDPDSGDLLSVVAVLTNGIDGSLVWSPDGAFSFDPGGSYEYLGHAETAVVDFAYFVYDGHLGTDVGHLTVRVAGVNDEPVAINDTAETSEDFAATFNVFTNDLDAENSLDTSSLVALTQPANGTVITGAIPGHLTFVPSPNFHGTNQFDYRICDVGGLCATGTVVVIVWPVDDLPSPTITYPSNGAVYVEGADIGVLSVVEAPDHAVTQVLFYAGAHRIGDASMSPYEATWTDPLPGEYDLSAIAEDAIGGIATSPTVRVTVLTDTDGDGSPDASDSDDDNDGMPDEWEDRHGLNRLVPDADVDADDDLFKNREEFIAYTDPTNALSFFRLYGPPAEEAGVLFSFLAVSGRTYCIDVTTDMAAGAWSALITNLIGDDSLVVMTNMSDEVRQYFRIGVEIR